MNVNSHGADIYTASKQTGIKENEIIDFSSNINPLGIPKSVESAAINSIKYSDRYPDINSRELVKAIALYEHVPEEWIFTSNGATEAIFRIAVYLKPKNGLVTAPAFSEYEQSLKTVGTCISINYYNLYEENEFKITNSILNGINNHTDIVFICNPNNPTGQLTDKETLEEIICRCEEMGATAVVDECFLDFVDCKDKYTVTGLMKKYNNLIILKAYTKIYAMPGIRLGYCMSSNIETINGLKLSGPPWNVSTIAQAAGVTALKEKDYVQKSVLYVNEQRKYLIDEMNKLKIKTYESHANYIFLKIAEVDLKEELLKKGILIRSCSNYMNLSSEYYRIAVRTKNENEIFIDKLNEIMGKR